METDCLQSLCSLPLVPLGWQYSSQTLSLVSSTSIFSFVPFIPLHFVLFALWYLLVPHHLYPQGLGDHAAEAEKVASWLHSNLSCPSLVCLEPVPPHSCFLL
uniref:Uncharacterized protein n=1 Tax=Rhinopithecus bieti TaxID=61621 RepID=A0A2K6LLB5_RHIBE